MGKKRHRSKTVNSEIPDVITANIGSSTRQEIESTPEVFESVHQPTDAIKSPTPPSEPSVASVSANESSSDVTSSAFDSTRPKRKPAPVGRRVCVTKENKVHPFAVGNLRIFSGSSGTHSYDSSRSARSLTRNLPRYKYVASSPLNTSKAEYMITNPQVEIRPMLFRSYSQPAFCRVVHGALPPDFGDFEPAAADEKNKQLIKEAVVNALAEFFATRHDDVRLTIRVRRERAQPIMEMKLTKKARKGRPSQRNAAKSTKLPSIATSSSSSVCCMHRDSNSNVNDHDDRELDTKTAIEPFGPSLAERCLEFGRSAYVSLMGFWSN